MNYLVSVAMASYNGEKYIEKQILSVLKNLEKSDELVISDDGSTDSTLEIIKNVNDSRIKLCKGPKKGINQNFSNAIIHCKGDYIFLCDQDDEWLENKVSSVIEVFKTKDVILVEHDAIVVDDNNRVIIPSFFDYRRVRTGFFKNWLRNTYHGCCMAFKSSLKDCIETIPVDGCLHDQWIGLIAELNGKTYFLDKKLMVYKRHSGNASSFKQYPFLIQLKNRIIIGCNITKYLYRKFHKNNIFYHHKH